MRIFCQSIVLLLGIPLGTCAQQVTIHAVVTDQDQRAVADAAVTVECAGQRTAGTTDSSGHADIRISPCSEARYIVASAGFAEVRGTLRFADANARNVELPVQLDVAVALSSVNVTANRTPLAAEASATSTVSVQQSQLQITPALTLDDKLRQVPGLELFRRSSSRVANPTTQGISLRGLGSTAASRTLLVSDLVPLNDPFGGWIHWNELPALAVDRVEIARGGGSDLYGSSAIGGVINLVTARPEDAGERFAFNGGYGGENTPFEDALWSVGARKVSGLAAASLLRTDGYILTAPSQRGTVDIPANVHYQSGRIELGHRLSAASLLFLRGNVFNEARQNGTRVQTNATRLWRYAGGANFNQDAAGAFTLRLYGSDEGYRQSFSAISAGRTTERLTRLQHTPAQEIGGAGQWSRSFGTDWTVLAGADARDVRATDLEQTILQGAPAGVSDTSARQREIGAYAEALFDHGPWSVAASARADRFSNLDTRQTLAASTGPPVTTLLPDRTEIVGNPRIGIVRRVGGKVSLSASAFRAFRSATLNELYRTGQVGQEITLPNANLKSERATGTEAGALIQFPEKNTAVRASYFFTEVNRPITALTLSVTPSQITKQRENLGQLQSRGVAFDLETRAAHWLTLTGGYQYALATITKFAPQPQLVANWLPQVPRHAATAQLVLEKRSLGILAWSARASGRQFDDDQNRFLLHRFFRLDAYAEHEFGRHVRLYASVENIADRAVEVGRTPVLTLGQPRTATVGLRFAGGNGK